MQWIGVEKERVNHNPVMATLTPSRWAPRLVTLALSALAGACVVYWGFKLSAPAGRATPVASAPEQVTADPLALARLLGAQAVATTDAPSLASRFVLMGLLAGTTSGEGAALIAMDGKPARPYRVGASLEPGLVLQSLSRREARLGPAVDGVTTLTLEIPRQKDG